MSDRMFSIIRRKPNLIDLVTPIDTDMDAYSLRWATTFGVPAVEIINCGNVGYLDPSLFSIPMTPVPQRCVRIVFNPDTYSIPDNTPFWLYLVKMQGGMDAVSSAATLVLPPTVGLSSFVVSGTAPVAADFGHALRLDLPRGAKQTVHFQNEADMGVGFDIGGPEMFLQGSALPKNIEVWMPDAMLFVRGIAADVPFSALFTANPIA